VEAALRDHWAAFRRLEVVDATLVSDPAKAELTCGIPAPELIAQESGSVPVQLTRRPKK